MSTPDLYGPARDAIAAFDRVRTAHRGVSAQIVSAFAPPIAALREAMKPIPTPAQLRAAGQIEAADKAADALIDEGAGRIVGEEIRLCVSWLVSELFKHSGERESIMDDEERDGLVGRAPDANDMRDHMPPNYRCEQGTDPSDGAVVWRWYDADSPWNYDEEETGPYTGPALDESDWFETEEEALADLYETEKLDPPEDREAMEHWAVSRWLAEKLKAKGEAVAETNFAGHVWARCTTGQMIRMDYIIRKIVRELYTKELTGVDA